MTGEKITDMESLHEEMLEVAQEDATDVVSEENYDENQEDTAEKLIVCDGLVKIYKTDEIEVMALQGLDLEVRRGEFISIIGKSGSGKSTLMNMIGGLETQTAGKIVVAGKNLVDMSEREMVEYRKKTVGFVWQKSARNLFEYLTSMENVMMAMCFSDMSTSQKKERAQELLKMVGMMHKKDSYPKQMSGGEQQRVAIAVALANEPDILLADEPTGAVDSKTADSIQELFRQLNKTIGITIIIVTHDMRIADKTNRVIMISDGKISTEKIMKEKYRQQIEQDENFNKKEGLHEEYTVMDKAHRIQLSKEALGAAGITTNKVRLIIEDGKLVIVGEDQK